MSTLANNTEIKSQIGTLIECKKKIELDYTNEIAKKLGIIKDDNFIYRILGDRIMIFPASENEYIAVGFKVGFDFEKRVYDEVGLEISVSICKEVSDEGAMQLLQKAGELATIKSSDVSKLWLERFNSDGLKQLGDAITQLLKSAK